MNDLESRQGDSSFKTSFKYRFGDHNANQTDKDGSHDDELNFDLTRVEGNQTISTKNSRSVKHVSFKTDNESPDKRLGGSMKTIEEEDSGAFDKIDKFKSPASSSNKQPRNSDSMMPQSDLKDLALVLNEI